MTRLLVSVRNSEEALEALAGGAQLIDVKEPARGSLGAASPQTWDEVRAAVWNSTVPPPTLLLQAPDRSAMVSLPLAEVPLAEVPLSAACGELIEWESTSLADRLRGYSYAKVGLAGCARIEHWELRWDRWMAGLPAATRPVAVVYADYRLAGTPNPWEVVAAAERRRVGVLLIDTCDKSRGDLFAWMTACELADLISQAREAEMRIALAGSISLDNLANAMRFGPDIVAARGAVCCGGREGRLSREMVNCFRLQLSMLGGGDAVSPPGMPIDSRSSPA